MSFMQQYAATLQTMAPNLISIVTEYEQTVICSKKFVDTLHSVGAKVDIVLFEGKTHTDLFLQVIIGGYFNDSDMVQLHTNTCTSIET